MAGWQRSMSFTSSAFSRTMLLRLDVVACYVGGRLRLCEQAREVQALGLPVREALARVEQIGADR
ncbi:hypothetical protein ALISP_6492 [Alicycliphilus sp. B1]|nr:hypothetical protein ALISP_6492 [Alicycliphilus sp. B1]